MRYSSSRIETVYGFFRKHRAIGKMLCLLLLFIALFICWQAGKAHELAGAPSKYIELPVSEENAEKSFSYLALTDMDTVTSAEDPSIIDLSEKSGKAEITSGGEYILTGSIDGSIYINVTEESVHLFFDNVDILSKAGPAIYCKNANRLVITLMDGSKNTISDSGDYRGYEDMDACIYSVCDLTVNGSGSLSVNGYYEDAISSKDITKIMGGTYNIKCKRTGIRGNDGVVITDGNFTISSEKNGIKTTKNGSDGRGNLMISGGEFYIIAGRYAFVTTKADIYIYNCSVYTRSIVNDFDCGGMLTVQRRCFKNE